MYIDSETLVVNTVDLWPQYIDANIEDLLYFCYAAD